MMLENGDFGVQRTTEHGLAQLPIDQAIENTLNRRTKTKGGIVGFSLKKNAVEQWLLTAHSRALFVDKCRMMAGKKEDNRLHKETGKSRIKCDEDVRKVMEVVSNWTNPFEPSEELASQKKQRNSTVLENVVAERKLNLDYIMGGMTKVYIALFTCATSQTIHLELVPSLTAKSFVKALARFKGRRGTPMLTVSDNGKTFKDSRVQAYCQRDGTTWRFNVEAAPWWGGFFFFDELPSKIYRVPKCDVTLPRHPNFLF